MEKKKKLPDRTPSMPEIVRALKLKVKNSKGDTMLVRCPFCGDQKYHLSISNDKWAAHCWKCGFGGNGLQLYAEATGISIKEAQKLFIESYGVESDQLEKEVIKKPVNFQSEPPLDVEKIDKVYTALLEMLKLSDRHKKNLINRGLEQREFSKYRTLPKTSYIKYKNPILQNEDLLGYDIAQRLIAKGYDLSGVPGFYTINGEWAMRYTPGLVIPVRDEMQRIVNIQVRTDEGSLRYITLSSSGMENGTRARTNIHVTGKVKKGSIIRITEGPLKADIAQFLTPQKNVVYIAIMGVNNTKRLYSYLQELYDKYGSMKVENCLDMDKLSNKNVRNASNKIKDKIISIGHYYLQQCWDLEFAKTKFAELSAEFGMSATNNNSYAGIEKICISHENEVDIDWRCKGIDDYLKYLKDTR